MGTLNPKPEKTPKLPNCPNSNPFYKRAPEVQEEKGKKLKDFEAALPGNADIGALKKEVGGWVGGVMALRVFYTSFSGLLGTFFERFLGFF